MGGNSIHVSDSLLGQSLSRNLLSSIFTLILDNSNQSSIFELLKAVPDDLTRALLVVRRSDSIAALSSVVGSQSADSDLSSDVQLVGHRSGSGVQPVGVIGLEVLEASSLGVADPL